MTTDRLLLKHVAKEDIPFVFDATRYPGFNDGMLWEPPALQAELLPNLKSSAIAWKDGTGYSFSVWSQESPASFIGRISIRKTETDKIYDIGYWTHPSQQQKGYATEAVGAILAFGFNELDAIEISACCATWNIASKRVLEKAGMEHRMYIAEGFKKNGQWVAEYLMSIRRDVWEK